MAIDSFANVVQFTATVAAGSVASVTTATALTTTTGNSFLVVVGCATGSRIGSTAVTDSKGNTYTRALPSTGVTFPGVSIFYKQAGTGGASHTFTFTPSASDFIWICAVEISGMTASPLSGTNAGTGSSQTHLSGTITSTTTELWVGAGVTNAVAELVPAVSVSSVPAWLVLLAVAATATAGGAVVALRSVATSVTGQFVFTGATVNSREAMIAGFKIQLPATGGGATSVAYLG